MINRLVWVLLGLLCSLNVLAGTNNHISYRTFWHPNYADARLAWCMDGGKVCGMATANQYCKIMGYDKAVSSTKAYDIGQSRYLATKQLCDNWRCDGFKQIKCLENKQHVTSTPYYYRKRVFYFPRFEHERLDWCYANSKSCGKKVAYSFCRRMGYMRTVGFKKQMNVAATEQLGTNQLCYGANCNGFEYISCYR